LGETGPYPAISTGIKKSDDVHRAQKSPNGNVC
jgi:hypothetical protein